jgi:Protein of unknown function (DUF3306)
MSDPDNFIARWSRRKRAAAEETAATTSPAAPDAAAQIPHAAEGKHQPGDAAVATGGALSESQECLFDVASLPPIESITAESDIRAFLGPGVPPELTRAALRRVWTADPKIRDFVGLADYDWDFNTPGGIPGFGPLEMTDELRRRITRMVGRSLAPDDSDQPAPTLVTATDAPPPVEASIESGPTTAETPTQNGNRDVGSPQDESVLHTSELHNSDAVLQRDKEHVAAQNNLEKPDNVQLIVKRAHGRALPK